VAVAVLHLLARDEGPRDGVAPGEVGMLKVKARVEYGHLDAVPRERRDVRADRLQAPRDARLVDRRRRGARRYRTASIDRLGRRCLYDNAMAESFVDSRGRGRAAGVPAGHAHASDPVTSGLSPGSQRIVQAVV
jgi:hypothetical protein